MAGRRRIVSWWVRDYAYALRWQAHATLRPRAPAALATGSGRPVVILPGVWERWGFLRPLADAVHAAGHPVHVVPALGRNGRPVPDAARVVARRLTELDLHDVVLVAHSKGGLVGKLVMADLDPDRRVTAMVAICTPFAGSRYARRLPSRTLREFSPDHPTTRGLLDRRDVNARITTVTGVFDPHIPRRGECDGGGCDGSGRDGGGRGGGSDGAENIVLDDGGHFRLLGHEAVHRIVLDVVGRQCPP